MLASFAPSSEETPAFGKVGDFPTVAFKSDKSFLSEQSEEYVESDDN
jgi:hypothetical protein